MTPAGRDIGPEPRAWPHFAFVSHLLHETADLRGGVKARKEVGNREETERKTVRKRAEMGGNRSLP